MRAKTHTHTHTPHCSIIQHVYTYVRNYTRFEASPFQTARAEHLLSLVFAQQSRLISRYPRPRGIYRRGRHASGTIPNIWPRACNRHIFTTEGHFSLTLSRYENVSLNFYASLAVTFTTEERISPLPSPFFISLSLRERNVSVNRA